MRDAQGKAIPDLGVKVLGLKLETGPTRFAKCILAPVKKNLMAVSSLVDSGHSVHLTPKASYIVHEASGKRIRVRSRVDPLRRTPGTAGARCVSALKASA